MSSLPRSSSIAGFATAPAPGVASTLSHIWLIAGVTATISFMRVLFPSAESCAARDPTSFN